MTEDEIAVEMGERVRNARESLGMTMEELAEKADLYVFEINNIEEGYLSDLNPIQIISLTMSLSDALGMSLDEMMGR